MDAHNLTSYPLKLPFIRSSKMARRGMVSENSKPPPKYPDFSSQPVSENEWISSQGYYSERTPSQSERSYPQNKKAPIEMQLEIFRKKAIEMGFSSERTAFEAHPCSCSQYQFNGCNDPRDPQGLQWSMSQPLHASSVPHHSFENANIRFSQQPLNPGRFGVPLTHEMAQDNYIEAPMRMNSCGSQPSAAMDERFQFRDPHDYYFESSSQPNFSRQRSGFDDINHLNFGADVALSDQSVAEEASLRLSSQRHASMPAGQAPMLCGALPHDAQSSAALPRYCRWSSEPRSMEDHFSERTPLRQFHFGEGQEQLLCPPKKTDSLRGHLSQFRNPKNSTNHSGAPKRNDERDMVYRPNISYESVWQTPRIRKKIANSGQTSVRWDSEDDDKNARPPRAKDAFTPHNELISNISPIAKSTPHFPHELLHESVEIPTDRKACCCCIRQTSVCHKSVQTNFSPEEKGRTKPISSGVLVDASVQANLQLDKATHNVGCGSSPNLETKSPSIRNSQSLQNDSREDEGNTRFSHSQSSNVRPSTCQGTLLSESDDGSLLDDLLLGLQREQ